MQPLPRKNGKTGSNGGQRDIQPYIPDRPGKEDNQVRHNIGLQENVWNKVRDSSLVVVENGTSVLEFLEKKIKDLFNGDQDAFFVADLDDVVKKHWRFLKVLPGVKPFYAVKCNSSPEILRTLAILGTGFDCASKSEITWIVEMGVSPANIIYANPCKQPSHIQYAARKGVKMMTFDCESELVKMAKHHPQAEMILRIHTNDDGSVSRLSKKFGARLEICEYLLRKAKSLNLSVTGVSFHIGSWSGNIQAFHQAIGNARRVFDIGNKVGHNMRILDLGGGLPGHSDFKPTFEEFAAVIMASLEQYFPREEGVKIIAEPGSYYVASTFTEAVNIIAKKEEMVKGLGEKDRKMFSYYLNDGLMGSFLLTEFIKNPIKLAPLEKGCIASVEDFPSRLWGPSCTEKDIVDDNIDLPELEVGDWLFFPNMGAYYPAFYTMFNGFLPPRVFYIVSQNVWRLLEEKWDKGGN